MKDDRLISLNVILDAIDANNGFLYDSPTLVASLKKMVNALPSAQPTCTNFVPVADCISRKAAIEAVGSMLRRKFGIGGDLAEITLSGLPPAQPNLSEAYSKAVFTWLMDYQTRAAELKGRYTPYEVLSWVINDWRKEHERSD